MPTSARLPPPCGRALAALVLAVVLAACSGDAGTAPPEVEAGQEPTASPPPTEPAQRVEATELPTRPGVAPSGPFPVAQVILRTAAGEAVPIAVHVAAEPDTRGRGLMHREDVPPGTGMLFLFPDDRTGAFWMKDTLVPLSIAFADADGQILRILDMEPCDQDPCPRYAPGANYRTALEVSQGDFARLGVREGDVLDLPGDLPAAR